LGELGKLTSGVHWKVQICQTEMELHMINKHTLHMIGHINTKEVPRFPPLRSLIGLPVFSNRLSHSAFRFRDDFLARSDQLSQRLCRILVRLVVRFFRMPNYCINQRPNDMFRVALYHFVLPLDPLGFPDVFQYSVALLSLFPFVLRMIPEILSPRRQLIVFRKVFLGPDNHDRENTQSVLDIERVFHVRHFDWFAYDPSPSRPLLF
jgi:hypothetical protein